VTSRGQEPIRHAGRSAVLLPVGNSPHHQGTTRTDATDDGTSGCDGHSRGRNTHGLWVADNNVIPTASNPAPTPVAFTVRRARVLLEHLDGE
jgi:choline dehydrogenase-like flavoprotein